MRVLFLETYFGGSHRAFAEGWRQRSRHAIELVGLPARKWKWRMQAGAAQLARMLTRRGDLDSFDVVVASSLFSAAEFKGLAPDPIRRLPLILYFHENQYSYPVRAGNKEFEWGVIHFTSSLAADALVFNSEFNRDDYLAHLEKGLSMAPDLDGEQDWLEPIAAKSSVVYPGVDVESFRLDVPREFRRPLTILWNHRWEHDKRPDVFFRILEELSAKGAEFRLCVCGESFRFVPECFERARATLARHIDHWGFLPSREEYVARVRRSDLVVSTAEQEFFGISVVEALAAGCAALLPDRLNYPNLIPDEHRARCLYADEADLQQRLGRLLRGEERPETAAPLPWLRRFSWPACAARMDDRVEAVAAAGHRP